MDKVDKISFKSGLTFIVFLAGLILVVIGTFLPADTPPVYDNEQYIVLDGSILRRSAIDYAYKFEDRFDGGSKPTIIIHAGNVIQMSYKTKEERDSVFDILIRKLKLRDAIEPK